MRLFMLKSLVLIAILSFAVLFGMEVAKNNMIQMQGIKVKQPSSALNFDIQMPKKASHVKVVKTETIQQKEQHLEKIKTFSPYEQLGYSFSHGVRSLFKKGISATSQTVKLAVESVTKP